MIRGFVEVPTCTDGLTLTGAPQAPPEELDEDPTDPSEVELVFLEFVSDAECVLTRRLFFLGR